MNAALLNAHGDCWSIWTTLEPPQCLHSLRTRRSHHKMKHQVEMMLERCPHQHASCLREIHWKNKWKGPLFAPTANRMLLWVFQWLVLPQEPKLHAQMTCAIGLTTRAQDLLMSHCHQLIKGVLWSFETLILKPMSSASCLFWPPVMAGLKQGVFVACWVHQTQQWWHQDRLVSLRSMLVQWFDNLQMKSFLKT